MIDQPDLQNGPRPVRVALALPLSRPRVTWILLGAIVVVFVIETAAGGSTETEVLIRLGAKVTHRIASGEYWRLFTAMFLHIGLLHLAFNGYALVALGTELERLIGWTRFMAVYLAAGLLGSLASYAFSAGLSAGASGAIFGIIGALGAYFYLHRQQLGAWGQRRLANVLLLIVVNIILGLRPQSGIDNLAHLGGLFGGLGLGWAVAPRYAVNPLELRLTDRNRLARYWPAFATAALILVAGSFLATLHHRGSADYLLSEAQDAVDREAWDEAAAELEQLVAAHPAEATAAAYFYLGLARNHLDQHDLASEAYESALELAPDDSSTHWNLALTYSELGRVAEACLQFGAYLALAPQDYDVVRSQLNELGCPAP